MDLPKPPKLEPINLGLGLGDHWHKAEGTAINKTKFELFREVRKKRKKYGTIEGQEGESKGQTRRVSKVFTLRTT